MKNILVVDDDPDIRLVCRDRLEHSGYVVHCAASGKHAIAILSTHDIDAMVLDLHLPRAGGSRGASIEQRAMPDVTDSVDQPSHSEQADKLVGPNGAQGFLAKPFENVALEHWVRQWTLPR